MLKTLQLASKRPLYRAPHSSTREQGRVIFMYFAEVAESENQHSCQFT